MKKKEVIKHSAAVQISNEVNLLQRRAWNVLLANAFDELDRKDQFQISVKDLCRVLGYDSRNDKHLKQLIRSLVDIKVEWNVLGKDGNDWGIAVLLAQAQIINGVLKYGYAPILRERMYHPAMYAKINLSLQNDFDSKHSLALYELFLDYYNVKNEYGETPVISIEDFRKLLGLTDDEYKNFRDLNYYVIKKALKEINKKTDLLVETEYKKKSRKVVALKFRINSDQIDENVIDIKGIEKKIIETQEEKQESVDVIDNQALFQVLTREFGISNGMAEKILKTKDEFYIEEVLELVRNQIESGKVKNIAAFTVKALEDDYRFKESRYELEKKKAAQQKQRVQKNERLIQELEIKYYQELREKTDKAFSKLSDKEKKDIIKQFEEERMVGENTFIQKGYKKKGLKSPGVRLIFRGFLSEKLLSEEDYEFQNWAKARGHNVKKGENGEYIIDDDS